MHVDELKILHVECILPEEISMQLDKQKSEDSCRIRDGKERLDWQNERRNKK